MCQPERKKQRKEVKNVTLVYRPLRRVPTEPIKMCIKFIFGFHQGLSLRKKEKEAMQL